MFHIAVTSGVSPAPTFIESSIEYKLRTMEMPLSPFCSNQVRRHSFLRVYDLSPVSVATPRDVGASDPVHLLSDNVGIRRVVRTHHNTGANLVQTISVYLNEENPLRLTHQLSIYTQIFHLHTSISSTLIHTSPCPLKRPPRMAERAAAKAILGDQVHARSRAAFAPHS